MTRYIVKLSEQEELSLKQLVAQQGFDALLKMLDGESLDAQADAMGCQGSREDRLDALANAQATVAVVSNLKRKLSAYRELLIPQAEATEDFYDLPKFERKH